MKREEADASMVRSLDDLVANTQRTPERELISSDDVAMFRSLKDHAGP